MDDKPPEEDIPSEAPPEVGVDDVETPAVRVPPSFQFPDDIGAAEAEFLQTVSTALWAIMQGLFELHQLSAPVLTVLVTADIMGSADSEGLRLGIGPDRRSGVERVGGVVTGKTLLKDDSSKATVLLSKDVFESKDSSARLQAAIALAHEFSHALYGVARNATVGISPDRWLPWEIAEVLALLAAEEYRCDRLAILLVEQVLTVTATDAHGKPLTLAAAIGDPYANMVIEALDEVSPRMQDTILQYRTHRIALQPMWNQVVRSTEGLLLLLAHAEAHNDHDESLLDATEHRGASFLKHITNPLFEYLRTTPLLPKTSKWVEDRAALKRIGRDGLMAMWAGLGLYPRPQGRGFYLQVTERE